MTGAKRDVAFLHGGGQGSWVWQQTISALRAQDDGGLGNMLPLDIPGCGVKRGRSTEHLGPRDVARELIADLEGVGMRSVVLVGHSLAGNVLPALAELRRDLFRRLVYVSCSIPLPGQTVLQMMGNGVHGSSEDEVGWPVDPGTTEMRDRYEAMYCDDMGEAEGKAFLAGLEGDEWPSAFFTNTRFEFDMRVVPATYVLCLKDRILPPVWQEKFAARFHAARIVRVDAGHQVMVTRPHTLAEIIRHEAAAGE